MLLFITSFVAGILTVLAPCILAFLPVIVGGSVGTSSYSRTFRIVGSLILSVVLFTILLKVSTAFIAIPPSVWSYISGGLILFFGLSALFPDTWAKIPFVGKLSSASHDAMQAGSQKKSWWGDVIVGASLGPVFSSCSPTYFIILATVLPQNFSQGLLYLVVYAIGLGISLLAIAFAGNTLVKKLGGVSDSKGIIKKSLGVLFVIVGILIILGIDKKLSSSLVANSNNKGVTNIEDRLLKKIEKQRKQEKNKTQQVSELGDLESKNYGTYQEITDPQGFLNTDGKEIKIADLIGKKIILIDFMTYSCINCQRTFPYLVDWYAKYKDKGLEVIGIHTPEFAFEKVPKNVQKELDEYGITFPIVLDNNYGTWNAYDNSYWPRKYIIDIDGTIVYDHIGEGDYDVTEKFIRDLLIKRGLTTQESIDGVAVKELEKNMGVVFENQTPETYLGTSRSEFKTDQPKNKVPQNQYGIYGSWKESGEYITNTKVGDELVINSNSKNVYLVMQSDTPAEVAVEVNGKKEKNITVNDATLYTIIKSDTFENHIISLKPQKPGVKMYVFTFGE